MIILHIPISEKSDHKLEQRLQDLVLAYQKVEHDEGEVEQAFIEEDSVNYKTKEEIQAWFRQLQGELDWQRSLSGDGCYIDPESGETC